MDKSGGKGEGVGSGLRVGGTAVGEGDGKGVGAGGSVGEGKGVIAAVITGEGEATAGAPAVWPQATKMSSQLANVKGNTLLGIFHYLTVNRKERKERKGIAPSTAFSVALAKHIVNCNEMAAQEGERFLCFYQTLTPRFNILHYQLQIGAAVPFV